LKIGSKKWREILDFYELTFQKSIGLVTNDNITANDGNPVDYGFIDVNGVFGCISVITLLHFSTSQYFSEFFELV